MARQLSPLTLDFSRQLLESKLRILRGDAGARPSKTLDILTGRVPDTIDLGVPTWQPPRGLDRPVVAAPIPAPGRRSRRRRQRRVQPRTVYLSPRNLADLQVLAGALERQEALPHVSRSAILRLAVEHLRTAMNEGRLPLRPTLSKSEHD